MSVKYCYVRRDGDAFEEIVKQSYDATKRDVCLKLGFIPIEVVLQDDTGSHVRVPGSNYQWYLSKDVLNVLEMIGDAAMSIVAVELWRIKRSMEMLKKQVSTPTAPISVSPSKPAVIQSTPSLKQEKLAAVASQSVEKVERKVAVKNQTTYVWPEQNVSGIRVIRTYADGSQLLDDGKERWLNEMWSQPVKYVCC